MVLSLTNQLAGQLVGKHFAPVAPDAYEKPVNLVVASNGIFRVVKTPVALFISKTQEIPADNRIPGLSPMEEGPELLIPKIPLKYLLQVLSFYRDVHRQDKTEASLLFFWNHNNVPLPTHYEATPAQTRLGQQGDRVQGLTQDGQLVIYCPQQTNTSGLSEFHEDGMVTYLRENCSGLCETHSHHTMNAFWSGTDNANENATQFYGVWGEIFKENPKFLFRWVEGKNKINIDPSFLFDIPQVEIKTTVTRTSPFQGAEPIVEEKLEYEAFAGPWEDVEYPEDWMPQHKVRKYTPKPYSGGYGAQQTGASYWEKQNRGAQGGAGHQLPSGNEHLDNYFGYDAYDGYGLVKDAPEVGRAHAADQKKNDETGEARPVTSVEIFIEEDLVDVSTAKEVEEQVKFICNELIQDGFDFIMSEALIDGHASFEEDDETKMV